MKPHVDPPDWINPIAVKELWQGTRSKGVLVTYLITVVFGASIVVSAQVNGSDGAAAFVGLITLHLLVAAIGVPLIAFQGVAMELDSGTHDLLRTTSLSPWKLAIGKFTSPWALSWVVASLYRELMEARLVVT